MAHGLLFFGTVFLGMFFIFKTSYFLRRRALQRQPQKEPSFQISTEDPDVILGLVKKVEIKKPPLEIKPELPKHIIFYLRAPTNQPYSGYELLQSLLACDLQFGEEDIFHRYENADEKKQICFSVASATKEGTLVFAEMGNFSCSGLIIFCSTNLHFNLEEVFEKMLETASQLLEDLGGTLLDDTQNLLTNAKLQELKNRVNRFQQNILAKS